MKPRNDAAPREFRPWPFHRRGDLATEARQARHELRIGLSLHCFAAMLLCFLGSAAWADSVVVFNEIMYHPATNEPAFEWVELHNQMSVDVDLSGWRFADGIAYTFPNSTVIKGGGYLVVAISPGALEAVTEITNVFGPFSDRLSNAGEKLELRDLNNRVMDEVNYGSDGDWPTGADGSGVSLAKKHPNLASKPAENWTVSAQVGGTPGAANFTAALLTGARTDLVPVTATWKYDDTGIDLGAAWRAPAYDDSAWPEGAGLFFFEAAPLPAPKNTPLTPGRNTYYFRGTFQITGDPAMRILRFRPLVDDGAVFYLNGVEIARVNMPTGAVSYSTMALAAVADAAYGGPFNIPSSNFVAGQNVLAVEVHQTTVTTNAGLRISRASAYTVAWDGGDGDFFSPGSPALVPTNAALASLGVDVFTSSNTNLAANVNDGRYGSSSTWSPATNDPTPYVVLRFSHTLAVSSLAWSRDNGDTNEAACGGTCTDRALGNCTFQYTLHTNPAVIIANSSNPSNGWTTVATVSYLSAQPGFTPYLRHRFDFAATNGAPILATGIRVRPAVSNTIDEIEINPPTVANFDAVFGMELTSTDILPPPPQLAFNEVSAASSSVFWLEVINTGDAPAELADLQIVRTGGGSPAYTFPAQSLPPGGLVSLTQAQLGFNATNGQKVFLFTPGRFLLLDAVTVKTSARGRYPDGTASWMYPSQPTPGASNVFVFHDEIVFNEIMYHSPPFDPVPAVTTNLTAVGLTGVWRYHDAGVDLGDTWRAPGYDDSAWPTGAGLLAYHTANLPAPANSTLAAGRTTYYFRTTFNFGGATSNLMLDLRAVVDDGAVFYLNGAEIHRQNMPLGPVGYASSATGPIGDAGYIGPVTLPASNLVEGVNVLAAEVHQITPAATSSGIVLSGGGLTLVEEGPFGGTPAMNLARQPGSAPFVIDSLAGYPIHNYVGLTDGVYGNGNSWIGNSGSPGYAGVRFGGLSTISSIAFGRDNTGTYSDRTLGTYTLQYTRVATPGTGTTFTGNADTGWATIGTLSYQGAGTGFFTSPSRRHRFTFTPVEATGLRLLVPGTGIGNGTCIDELEVNPPDTSGDIAFGAELVLTTTLAPAVPFAKSGEEWVEFHNRSTNDVDLTNWRIDGGIDYHFPTGTVVQAGAYLVVARDAAALRANWLEVAESVLGNFSNRLREGDKVSLKDSAGNIVNAIRVEGSRWSDGGGSSLELIDPRADNSHPAAWADSEESTRSEWGSVTYRMVAGQRYGPSFWNEFRIGMLEAGEVLVDDVSVVQDPDTARQQLIQNGDFETTTGNTHWRMLGNHGQSQIILDPDHPANHVLKVAATSPARTSHNHIESSFVNNTPLVDGHEYEVSFRARWLAGSPQLHTSAYFQRLARTTLLPMPARHGTPGAPNSRRVTNAGPTLSDLAHSPVIPQANEPVTISVRATDPDGVASATLNYRVNPETAFTSMPMTLAPDGAWKASISGQTAGKIVHFFISAQDGLGVATFAPAKGPDSRALYQVADAQGSALPAHELRLIQLDAERDFMFQATNVMSQERLGATVIYNRSEVFYDAGLRLQGTAAGRIRDGEDYVSYDIGFPPDHRFRGVQGNLGIDRSGRGPVVRQQDEIYILHLFQRAGLPCYRGDLCYFIAPKTVHTGTALMQLGTYDGLFVDEQFGQEGSVLNLDLNYEPSTTVDGTFEAPKLPVPHQAHLQCDFADLGNDKEQYRAPLDIRYGERADDYTGIIRLCQTMGLPQDPFDAQIPAALDVSEALRLTALTILCGIGDIYFSPVPSWQHNCRIFTATDGSPAQFLPWDMDFVFYLDASSSIFPTTANNISKLVNHPANRRLYLWHVQNLCQTVFNTTYMSPWLAHYGSVVGQNYTGNATYIQNRRNAALSQLPPDQPFAITSNEGNDFTTDTNLIVLSGTAPISVRMIEVNGISYPITWTTISNWTFTVPLYAGINSLVVQGVDGAGLRASNVIDTITVTNNGPSALLPVVINEWMADNAGPGGFPDPLDGFFQDWCELYNPNNAPVNLSGYRLTDTLVDPTHWTFPSQTVIGPHGFLLVWADGDTAQNGTGTNGDLHASFKLNNSGEAIGLYSPSGVRQHAVTFGAQIQNVSQGLFPDGDTNAFHFMTNWTPRAPNRLDALPYPNIENLFLESNGTISFSFATSPGRLYEVQFTDDLGVPEWLPLTVLRALAATLLVTVDTAGVAQRFYRVVLVQ